MGPGMLPVSGRLSQQDNGNQQSTLGGLFDRSTHLLACVIVWTRQSGFLARRGIFR
jgi:hypothetical protein